MLCPVKHRSARAQADLTVIRARAGLVRARTALVNTARGMAKSGERLRGCNVRNLLKQIKGVGSLIALTYMLTLEGAKVGGVAASPVGERRGIRTVAQQPTSAAGDRRIKTKHHYEGKSKA